MGCDEIRPLQVILELFSYLYVPFLDSSLKGPVSHSRFSELRCIPSFQLRSRRLGVSFVVGQFLIHFRCRTVKRLASVLWAAVRLSKSSSNLPRSSFSVFNHFCAVSSNLCSSGRRFALVQRVLFPLFG